MNLRCLTRVASALVCMTLLTGCASSPRASSNLGARDGVKQDPELLAALRYIDKREATTVPRSRDELLKALRSLEHLVEHRPTETAMRVLAETYVELRARAALDLASGEADAEENQALQATASERSLYYYYYYYYYYGQLLSSFPLYAKADGVLLCSAIEQVTAGQLDAARRGR